MDDLISRQAAIDALTRKMVSIPTAGEKDLMGDVNRIRTEDISAIRRLPSAQPEQTNSWYINSWCNNCKEYDKEKHSCPRFNRVIKQTLDEIYAHAETEAESRFHAQQRWIPCSERLPSEGENVLLCDTRFGKVAIGKLIRYNTSCCWEVDHWDCDIEDWQAWMPLPKPYREEGD